MTTNVKVRTRPTIKVKVTSGGLIPTQAPITLKHDLRANRLDGLDDVDSSVEVDGAALVYQANTDQYVVRNINLNDFSGLDLSFNTTNNAIVSYGSAANTYFSKIIQGAGGQVNVSANASTINVSLIATGVIANTYGNASSVPVITVDEFGRITSATTNAVAGVSGFTYAPANNTLVISTSSGASFAQTINSVNNFNVTSTANVSILNVSGNAIFTSNIVANNISGVNLSLSGNLTVSGTTTYINTTSLAVSDNIIALNADLPPSSPPLENAGIEINRGSSANAYLIWQETPTQWTTNGTAFAAGPVTTTTLTANGTALFGNSIVAGPNTFVVNAASGFVGIRNGSPTAPLTIGPAGAVLTTPLLQATDSLDSYIQVAIQNLNAGPFASGDFVVTADNGTDLTNYIDLGKASSGYNYPDFSFIQPNDGYLLNANGNLLIAQGLGGEIRFFANGTLASNRIVTMKADSSNTVAVNGAITAVSISANINAADITSGVVDLTRLPSASVSAIGVVQLNDSTNDSSIGTAATANAVKTAYNLASTANTAAGTAYSNAIVYASNASNITSGTLDTDRLPATANVSTAINVGANVTLSTTQVNIGNSTVNTVLTSTAVTTNTLYANTISTSVTNGNLVLDPNGTGIVVISNASGGATGIQLGTPTLGALSTNAVALATTTSVTNGIAQLNSVLGKLVPSPPTAFPNGTLTLNGTTSYRVANFTQTDNTPSSRSVAGGSTISVIRASTFTTTSVLNSGPGDTGTVTAYFNNVAAGSVTLSSTPTANTVAGKLQFYNNYDYNTVNTSIAAGFWSVFSANGSGSGVSAGWNEFKIGHSAAGNTNTVAWYYDSSAPGTPIFTSTSLAVASQSLTYSSTVPHYNSSTSFNLVFYVNRLSGDTYPTSDTFATGSNTSTGAFTTPASVTYAAAGVTTPLARNLYVASGNTGAITTTSSIVSGFGANTGSLSVTVNNSYNSGSTTFSPGTTVLYKTGLVSSATRIEEANVYFGSTVGTGTGAAARIINPGSTDTPTYTASASLFDSQTSTLQTYDATVVGNVLKHDQTNYSAYLPAGPNLSTGRTGSQYYTFKFVRTGLSKFDIRYTGTIAGLFVALPGSAIDTTSTLNGWLDCSLAYNNAGIPGANTAAGGNGTNGCGFTNLAVLNSAQTNKNVTVTFGTTGPGFTATNEVYVRVKLTSGQTVTALSLQTASA